MGNIEKLSLNDIGGSIVKNNDTYLLNDNTTLKNLVLSSTRLNPLKSTRGHSHAGQEEIYFFLDGYGEMEIDDQRFPVKANDVILIEDGVFHRVHNTSDFDLYFVCIFDGGRNH